MREYSVKYLDIYGRVRTSTVTAESAPAARKAFEESVADEEWLRRVISVEVAE